MFSDPHNIPKKIQNLPFKLLNENKKVQPGAFGQLHGGDHLGGEVEAADGVSVVTAVVERLSIEHGIGPLDGVGGGVGGVDYHVT